MGSNSDILDRIMQYECNAVDMSYDEFLEFFQDLVSSGLAWQLQGHYGRTARDLIDQGLIHE